MEAADSEDHLLTVESVGLDATRDRLFLTELAAQLNFDLNVQRPSDMKYGWLVSDATQL